MSKWQPIETAPRDGSEILVYSPQTAQWDESFDIVWWSGEYWKTGAASPPGPTHWMPLPQRPHEKAVS